MYSEPLFTGGGGNTIYKLGTIRKRKFNEFERTHRNNETDRVLSNGVLFCNEKNCFTQAFNGLDRYVDRRRRGGRAMSAVQKARIE